MSAKIVRKAKKEEVTDLRSVIIAAIQDKKGEEIICLDLKELNESVTDYFIICHATSKTQVKAIADNIMAEVKTKLNERPWHSEGFENNEWILLDFVDTVAHVFLKDKREFYLLEDLWDDAKRTEFE